MDGFWQAPCDRRELEDCVAGRVDPKAAGVIAVPPELAMVSSFVQISSNGICLHTAGVLAALSDLHCRTIPDVSAKQTWGSPSEVRSDHVEHDGHATCVRFFAMIYRTLSKSARWDQLQFDSGCISSIGWLSKLRIPNHGREKPSDEALRRRPSSGADNQNDSAQSALITR